MSYENSKACKMVATHCLCCGRALVDAKSVEAGIGPICRSKYGYDLDVSEQARAQANQLVYEIACDQGSIASAHKCEVLKDLGFSTLADRVLERMTKVTVEVVNQEYVVKGPYVSEAGLTWKHFVGTFGRWDPTNKVRRFFRTPANQKAIWAALQSLYPGMVGRGPKGFFFLGNPEPVQQELSL